MADLLQDHIHAPDPYDDNDGPPPASRMRVQFKRELAGLSMTDQQSMLSPESGEIPGIQFLLDPDAVQFEKGPALTQPIDAAPFKALALICLAISPETVGDYQSDLEAWIAMAGVPGSKGGAAAKALAEILKKVNPDTVGVYGPMVDNWAAQATGTDLTATFPILGQALKNANPEMLPLYGPLIDQWVMGMALDPAAVAAAPPEPLDFGGLLPAPDQITGGAPSHILALGSLIKKANVELAPAIDEWMSGGDAGLEGLVPALEGVPGASGPLKLWLEGGADPIQLLTVLGEVFPDIGPDLDLLSQHMMLAQTVAGPAALDPVQYSGSGSADASAIHAAAAEGTKGSGGSLPHLDKIQSSFGKYDVGGVKAYTGGDAARANTQMGSLAYASGSKIAFKSTPDVHTAAHEAAHIVQQAAGVSLPGGVGSVGDKYEKHADAVASKVVSGQSAESVLDSMTGAGGGSSVQNKLVQHQLGDEEEEEETLQASDQDEEEEAVPASDQDEEEEAAPDSDQDEEEEEAVPASDQDEEEEAVPAMEEEEEEAVQGIFLGAGPLQFAGTTPPPDKKGAEAKLKALKDAIAAAATPGGVRAAAALYTPALKACRKAGVSTSSIRILQSDFERAEYVVKELDKAVPEVYGGGSDTMLVNYLHQIGDHVAKFPKLSGVRDRAQTCKDDLAVVKAVKSLFSNLRTKPDEWAGSELKTKIDSAPFKKFGDHGKKVVETGCKSFIGEASSGIRSALSYPNLDELDAKITLAEARLTAEAYTSSLGSAQTIKEEHKERLKTVKKVKDEWAALGTSLASSASTVSLTVDTVDKAGLEKLKKRLDDLNTFKQRLSDTSVFAVDAFNDPLRDTKKAHEDLTKAIADVKRQAERDLKPLQARDASKPISDETLTSLEKARVLLAKLEDPLGTDDVLVNAPRIALDIQVDHLLTQTPEYDEKLTGDLKKNVGDDLKALGKYTPGGMLDTAVNWMFEKAEANPKVREENESLLRKAYAMQTAGNVAGLIPFFGVFAAIPSGAGKTLEKLAQGESVFKALVHGVVEGGQAAVLGLIPGVGTAVGIVTGVMDTVSTVTGTIDPDKGKIKLEDAKEALTPYVDKLKELEAKYTAKSLAVNATLKAELEKQEKALKVFDTNLEVINLIENG